MHFLVAFGLGFAVGGSAVGYFSYNYGKKAAAAFAALKKA